MLQAGLWGSLLALIVIIFRRLFYKRVSKRIIYILWLLVFLKFLIVIDFDMPFNLQIPKLLVANPTVTSVTTNNIEADANVSANETMITYEEKNSGNGIKSKPTFGGNNKVNTIDRKTIDGKTSVIRNPSVETTSIWARVWLLGMCVWLCGLGVSYYHLNHRFRYAQLDQSDRVKALVKYIDIQIYRDRVPVPTIIGLIKPKIILPIDDKFIDDEALEYVLIHEIEHLKYKDCLVNFLALVIVALHWYNPIIWLSYYLFKRDIESFCDERVIAEIGEHKKADYATALLHYVIPKTISLPVHALSFNENNTKERVEGVLNYKKAGVKAVLLAILLLGITVIFFLTNGTGNMKIVDVIGLPIDKTFEFVNVNELPSSPAKESKFTLLSQDEFMAIYHTMSEVNYQWSQELGLNETVSLGKDTFLFNISDGQENYHFTITQSKLVLFVNDEQKSIAYYMHNGDTGRILDKIQSVIKEKEANNGGITDDAFRYIETAGIESISFLEIFNRMDMDLFQINMTQLQFSINEEGFLDAFKMTYLLEDALSVYEMSYDRGSGLFSIEVTGTFQGQVGISRTHEILINARFVLDSLMTEAKGQKREVALLMAEDTIFDSKTTTIYYNGEMLEGKFEGSSLKGLVYRVDAPDMASNPVYYVYGNGERATANSLKLDQGQTSQVQIIINGESFPISDSIKIKEIIETLERGKETSAETVGEYIDITRAQDGQIVLIDENSNEEVLGFAYDSLYGVGHVKKGDRYYALGYDFFRYLERVEEFHASLSSAMPHDSMTLLNKYGWSTDMRVFSEKITLPNTFTYEAGDYPEALYWAYNNTLSAHIGYDMKAYMGQEVEVEIYMLREALPEYMRPRRDARGIIVKYKGQIVGAFIDAGRHTSFACSLDGLSLETITDGTWDQWVDGYINYENPLEKDLKQMTPEQIINTFYKAIDTGNKKLAAACFTKKNLSRWLSVNMNNKELYNKASSMDFNMSGAKVLSIQPIDIKNPEGYLEFRVEVELDVSEAWASEDGLYTRFIILRQETKESGWRIVGIGTGP